MEWIYGMIYGGSVCTVQCAMWIYVYMSKTEKYKQKCSRESFKLKIKTKKKKSITSLITHLWCIEMKKKYAICSIYVRSMNNRF